MSDRIKKRFSQRFFRQFQNFFSRTTAFDNILGIYPGFQIKKSFGVIPDFRTFPKTILKH